MPILFPRGHLFNASNINDTLDAFTCTIERAFLVISQETQEGRSYDAKEAEEAVSCGAIVSETTKIGGERDNGGEGGGGWFVYGALQVGR